MGGFVKKTTLQINFDAVKQNIDYLAKDMDVFLVAKGLCYGTSFASVEKLIAIGYLKFCVSTIEEAYILRKINPDIEILILLPIENEEINEALLNNFQITITSLSQLKVVNNQVMIHLKFDTGMGRIGFGKNDINEVKKNMVKKNIIGIYSHFAFAADDEVSNNQIKVFKDIVDAFEAYNFKYIHIQNSLGAIKYDIDFVNTKRLGIGIWGYLTNKKEMDNYGTMLKESLTLVANVIQNKEYQGYIGYDCSEYVEGKIATLAFGYHDGLFRKATGYVFKDGSKIVGKVCMCQTMLLVDEYFEKKEIFGKNESIYDIVEYCGVTVYEFLSALSSRIKKI